MCDQYENARDVWEFERFLASKPHVWLVEATNLRLACDALLLYDDEVTVSIFDKREQPRLPAFFSARIERMLMGFALENVVKAILLQNPEELRVAFSREGNLKWTDAHNLLALFERAGICLTREESFYVKAWQVCAIWAGRYPIPMNEYELPKHRRGLSKAALIKRSQKRIERALKEGDPLLGIDLNDLIHSGVGGPEKKTFDAVFDRCRSMLPSK
jgi:hypothetical protein